MADPATRNWERSGNLSVRDTLHRLLPRGLETTIAYRAGLQRTRLGRLCAYDSRLLIHHPTDDAMRAVPVGQRYH